MNQIEIHNTNKLYCLSGLGTDKRAFINLKIESVELIHVPWIDNLENETLKDYAKRLFDHVNPENGYNLLGLSFGGMIASEWEKIKAPKNLFLLSTVSDKSNLPRIIKIAGKLKLHKITPISILTSANFMSYYIFGINNDKNRDVFQEILRDTDPKHLRWAINAIANWSNDAKSNGISIHGDNDKLLPIWKEMDYVIKDGGHMIIMNKADQIGKIIESFLVNRN